MLADYPSRPQWLLYLLLFALLLLITPQAGHYFDVACWTDWSTYMSAHGLTRGYEVDSNNYNPLYQYVLFGYGKLVGGDAEHIIRYRLLLKLFTLLFDFGGAIVAVRCFGWGDANQRFMLSLLFLLNVGYLYNTVAWAQVDAILGTLVFWAAVQALRQRLVSSLVLFLLAVNLKSQGIIFLPPLLLLWAPLGVQAPRRLAWGLLLLAGVQLAILAPYILAGKMLEIIDFMQGAVGFYPKVSMNCYNMWALLLRDFGVLDTRVWAGLTYKQWGLLSFLVASAVALLPLGLTTLHKLRSRTLFGRADAAPVLLSLGLIPLVFCFFNTQMHERYWHPALLFLGAHGILTRRYWLFFLFSGAYYMNLEAVLRFQLPPEVVHTTVLFWPKTIAWLFAAVLGGGVWQLYRPARLRATWQQVRRPQAPVPVAAAPVATPA
ncbi:MAG: hypothetical protein EOO59_04080 [Hymenobacter sp.]|nr:MAG: hypothetical protein EOO59_04080 [Hymenobacter sp.]